MNTREESFSYYFAFLWTNILTNGPEELFTLSEGTATVEWVSSEAFGAAADSLVVLDTAVSALSTRSIARVGAFQVETGQVAAALLMLRTLWVTARERIAQEVGRARTDGAVILCIHIYFFS